VRRGESDTWKNKTGLSTVSEGWSVAGGHAVTRNKKGGKTLRTSRIKEKKKNPFEDSGGSTMKLRRGVRGRKKESKGRTRYHPQQSCIKSHGGNAGVRNQASHGVNDKSEGRFEQRAGRKGGDYF